MLLKNRGEGREVGQKRDRRKRSPFRATSELADLHAHAADKGDETYRNGDQKQKNKILDAAEDDQGYFKNVDEADPEGIRSRGAHERSTAHGRRIQKGGGGNGK